MSDAAVATPMDAAPGVGLLSRPERRSLSIQLTLSIIAAGLLILSVIFHLPSRMAKP